MPLVKEIERIAKKSFGSYIQIMSEKLSQYRKKRNLSESKEPKATISIKKTKAHKFVVQKHHAKSLHFDFRLEDDGVLKSWAVPKGISRKIGEKHLAIQVEDHPLSYAKFKGVIPEGHYGAGKVEIWDSGTFENEKEKSLKSCIRAGKIEVKLKGKKLKGSFALIRFKPKEWLIFKMKAKK